MVIDQGAAGRINDRFFERIYEDQQTRSKFSIRSTMIFVATAQRPAANTMLEKKRSAIGVRAAADPIPAFHPAQLRLHSGHRRAQNQID